MQRLLVECQPLVEDAEWEQVRVVIDRIINSPNKLKSNLESALAFVNDANDRSKGRRLIVDILEFIQEAKLLVKAGENLWRCFRWTITNTLKTD